MFFPFDCNKNADLPTSLVAPNVFIIITSYFLFVLYKIYGFVKVIDKNVKV